MREAALRQRALAVSCDDMAPWAAQNSAVRERSSHPPPAQRFIVRRMSQALVPVHAQAVTCAGSRLQHSRKAPPGTACHITAGVLSCGCLTPGPACCCAQRPVRQLVQRRQRRKPHVRGAAGRHPARRRAAPAVWLQPARLHGLLPGAAALPIVASTLQVLSLQYPAGIRSLCLQALAHACKVVTCFAAGLPAPRSGCATLVACTPEVSGLRAPTRLVLCRAGGRLEAS